MSIRHAVYLQLCSNGHLARCPDRENKMLPFALRTAVLASVCLLAGCSVFCPQRSPAETGAPGLKAAGLDQAGSHALSPDGRKLLWQVAAGAEITTLVREFATGATQTFNLGRNFPYWAYDSRHLIVEQDRGSGNTQILLLDTERPKTPALNLTPWQGSKSYVIHIGDARTGKMTFISNRRNATAFDVYTSDFRNGKVELLMQNAGDVVQWVMDEDGTVGARVRRQDGHSILQVLNKSSHTWKSVYKWQQTEVVLPVRIERDAGRVLLVSNAGRDKAEMVELRIAGR